MLFGRSRTTCTRSATVRQHMLPGLDLYCCVCPAQHTVTAGYNLDELYRDISVYPRSAIFRPSSRSWVKVYTDAPTPLPPPPRRTLRGGIDLRDNRFRRRCVGDADVWKDSRSGDGALCPPGGAGSAYPNQYRADAKRVFL